MRKLGIVLAMAAAFAIGRASTNFYLMRVEFGEVEEAEGDDEEPAPTPDMTMFNHWHDTLGGDWDDALTNEGLRLNDD